MYLSIRATESIIDQQANHAAAFESKSYWFDVFTLECAREDSDSSFATWALENWTIAAERHHVESFTSLIDMSIWYCDPAECIN
jgi:hypothetical protein